MTGEPWSWQCEKCERFLDWDDLIRAKDGQYWHWDAIKGDWCGPAQKVELR